jgi:hypothetical protein
MAIEKSLYAAPQGLEELAGIEDGQIEIEIEDPESVTIDMGDMEIEITPDAESDEDFNANLAEYISEEVLQNLASD